MKAFLIGDAFLIQEKWRNIDAHRCLGVASSFPRGGKVCIHWVNCHQNAELLRRGAAGLILFFLSLRLVGRPVQTPKCWCLVLLKKLYSAFLTSCCLCRSAQSLRHPVLYLPALLQVSWILWDVKNGTSCLCLGPESIWTRYSCEMLIFSGEWE